MPGPAEPGVFAAPARPEPGIGRMPGTSPRTRASTRPVRIIAGQRAATDTPAAASSSAMPWRRRPNAARAA
jgi:hypothetical protein